MSADRIVWRCSACRKVIDDDFGYVLVDVREATRVLEERAAWDEAHQGALDGKTLRVIDGNELMTYPRDATWRALHSACDPRPDSESEYCIEVDRCRSPWDLIHWTAHLWEKNWIRATDWDHVLRVGAER